MFDMTYSDSDAKWTYAPDAVDHLRVVESHVNLADGSALPLSYAQVGSHFAFRTTACTLLMPKVFLATVELHGVTIKEEFIVASVTTPLLSLGRLMGFKRNSLCVTGNIRMLSGSDDVAHLRAVELQSSLDRVGLSWTQLGPECFGIRSAKVSLVDVALAPSSTVLRYRTTLVRCGQRWDVVEHNQRDSDAQGSNPFQTLSL